MNYFQLKAYVWIKNSPSILEIEVVQQRKIPFLQLIGGGNGSKSAQRERILAALDSIGEKLPARKFIVRVNGEGDFPREMLDLPIALAILGSANRISSNSTNPFVFGGALSLDGRLESPISQISEQKFPSLQRWIGPKGMLVGGNEVQQLKTFTHLRDCLSFLRSEMPRKEFTQALEPSFPKFEVLWPRPFFRELVYLHLVGGFPLYIEGLGPDEIRIFLEKLQFWYFGLHHLGKKDLSGPLQFPKLHIFSYSGDAKGGTRIKAKVNGLHSLESGHILAFPRLDRSAELLPVFLAQSTWMSGPIRENPTELRSQWVGFGNKCYCENPHPCRCRVQERRNWDRNSQTIGWYFPLQWKRETDSLLKIEDQEAIQAFRLAMDRQNGRNYYLTEAEVLETKEWSFQSKQWLRYLFGKELGTSNLPKVALTCSDLRGATRVEEEDVLQALHYTSNFDNSGFPSGMKRSKGSAPVKNSTAIP